MEQKGWISIRREMIDVVKKNFSKKTQGDVWKIIMFLAENSDYETLEWRGKLKDMAEATGIEYSKLKKLIRKMNCTSICTTICTTKNQYADTIIKGLFDGIKIKKAPPIAPATAPPKSQPEQSGSELVSSPIINKEYNNKEIYYISEIYNNKSEKYTNEGNNTKENIFINKNILKVKNLPLSLTEKIILEEYIKLFTTADYSPTTEDIRSIHSISDAGSAAGWHSRRTERAVVDRLKRVALAGKTITLPALAKWFWGRTKKDREKQRLVKEIKKNGIDKYIEKLAKDLEAK